MATLELIRGTRQTLWGRLAVANFVLGGLGAGVYVLAATTGTSQDLRMAALLGPTLVLAGFAAVGLEAGHPWRGLRVLRRVRSSWMSRELWLGAAFALLAVADVVQPAVGLRLLAGLAALGLTLAQGSILRAARGVPNWNVGVMPLLFVASALVSGSGLLALIDIGTGHASTQVQVTAAIGLLVVGAVVWLKYGTIVQSPSMAGMALLAGGYVIPIALELVALAYPDLVTPAAAFAGLLMLGGQIHAKALVILSAHVRPIRLVVNPGPKGSAAQPAVRVSP